MKYIEAFLVVCAAHNILVVSSSGAVLLQESYKQQDKLVGETSPDEPRYNGTSNEAGDTSQQDETSSESLPDEPRYNGTSNEASDTSQQDETSSESLPDEPRYNGIFNEASDSSQQDETSSEAHPDEPRYNGIFNVASDSSQQDETSSEAHPDEPRYNGNSNEASDSSQQDETSSEALPDEPRYNGTSNEASDTSQQDETSSEALPDESRYNGNSNEASDSSQQDETSSEMDSRETPQSEIYNADTISRETIINRQTHTNAPSSDHTNNETPSYVNEPFTYNPPSEGQHENNFFKYNIGASQTLNPSNRQIPYTNSYTNSPTFNLPPNGIQSYSSSPFITLILSTMSYNSPPYNSVPNNAIILNISPYNVPPLSVTPYNNPPFGNNPYNVPPFGNNQFNVPPFGNNQFNVPPFGNNPYNVPPFGYNPYNVPPSGHNPFNQLPFGHNPFNQPPAPFGNNPFNESPFGNNNPYNESPFGITPYKDPPQLNELSDPFHKKNCSRQLRISEIKCRTYSECSVIDCDDPPPPPPQNVAFSAFGVDANKYEFPHAAALGWKLANRTDYSWACGGSLISELFILTAAHCTRVRDSSFVSDEPEIVRLGELDFSDEDGDIQDIAIAEIIRHPDYKWPIKYSDIALLRLAKRASFGDSVRPTCLWTKDTIPEYTSPIAIGWGALYHDGAMSEKLQKVYLGVVKQEKCEESYGRSLLKSGIIPEQLCAGDVKMDTCRGDSGGPLTIYSNGFDCSYNVHQIGITSIGKTCGKGIPGVYTRVSAYIDWIEEHVWPITT